MIECVSRMTFRLAGVWMVGLCASVTLAAQGRGYHAELAPQPNGAERLTLVNDSDKAIEAYHISARCPAWFSAMSYDSLEETMPGEPGVVMAHGRRLTVLTLPGRSESCSWKAAIDAVIYADGSYEGNRDMARRLQAHRDGIVVSMRLWGGAVHESASAIVAEAGQRVKKDHEEEATACQQDGIRFRDATAERRGALAPTGDPTAIPAALWTVASDIPSVDCEYWRGRVAGDRGLSALGHTPPQNFDRDVVAAMERWQNEIDGDEALKKLDVVFPLLASLRGKP